jgi:hypothetical protein
MVDLMEENRGDFVDPLLSNELHVNGNVIVNDTEWVHCGDIESEHYDIPTFADPRINWNATEQLLNVL